MKRNRHVVALGLALAVGIGAALQGVWLPGGTAAAGPQAASVIFFHPDGMAVNHWGAVRMLVAGPDGRLNWDLLPHMAVYTGHMKDGLTGSSHGGATVHAYGVKVVADSFGLDGDRAITARSGRQASIMMEAKTAGMAIGLVQTGSLTEPGTAAFVASTPRRGNHEEIARIVVESQPEVALGGGERWLLPRGVRGRFGEGARTDGLNLIDRLRQLGYTVVYTREELLNLPEGATRVFGVFASNHTFNDRTEEDLRRAGLPMYEPTAPTIAEMIRVAVRVLSRNPRGFFLVAEEEGTDNFGNANNASGTLEAGRRADEAIGFIRQLIRAHPNTLMLTTADSDAGGLQVVGPNRAAAETAFAGGVVPARDPNNGAPLDGVEGTGGRPFMSAPDRAGQRLPFAIAWATLFDVTGGILVRAVGRNAELVRGTMDSTDVYRVMYQTLFGRVPANR
jgi:alkaline phosphatase